MGHGHATGGKVSSEYSSWRKMMLRCYNPNAPRFDRYGGRGITVYEPWHRFEAFFASMGQKPTPQHTLDRIENDGNYDPSNCRWATKKEQARNTRRNTLLTLNGVSHCIAEWSEITGIAQVTIIRRLARGMTQEQALTKPGRNKPSLCLTT